jgi:hypothetical protein
MARKYEPVPASGFYCWSLEKPEEEIFVAEYGETSDLIPPGQKWQRTLEEYFFEHGKGLADEALNEINRVRKHHGLEPIQIRETAVGDYATSRDEVMKSERRRQIRKELSEASPEVRRERLAQAKADEKRLLPPHYTYEEFKSRKLQQNAAAPSSQEEVAERVSACRAVDDPAVIPIGVRMPPRSEKHANFRRLAEARTERVLEDIRKLENLASPNYEFEETEAEKIFDTIQEHVAKAHDSFQRRLTKRTRFTL